MHVKLMCASWEYVNIETQLWNDSLFDNFYGFGRKPSKKLSLVKIWTVFPPQISCMARIVSCRLMMKVTVMLLLSSITMFSLLAQNFHCLTSLFKNKHNSTIFVDSIQRDSLETQKQKDSLSLICTFQQHKRLNEWMSPLRSIDKYQIIDKRGCLSIKCFE